MSTIPRSIRIPIESDPTTTNEVFSCQESTGAAALHNYYHQQRKSKKCAIRYIDIKAISVIVSLEIHQSPSLTNVLRLEFTTFTVGQPKAIGDWVATELNEINQHAANRKLIILHPRLSNRSANPGLDLPDEVWIALAHYLESIGYAVWFILATSRANPSLTRVFGDRMSTPFSAQLAAPGDDKTNYMQCRRAHIELLSRLHSRPNLVGVIGNTSGTLDVAAFIGMRVLDLHTCSLHVNLDYQAGRLFALAVSVMDIQLLPFGGDELVLMNAMRTRGEYKLTSELVNKYLPVLSKWLEKETQRAVSEPLSFASLDADRKDDLRSLFSAAKSSLWGNDQLACEKRFALDSVGFHCHKLPSFTQIGNLITNKVKSEPKMGKGKVKVV